jgi:hypothetical protein
LNDQTKPFNAVGVNTMINIHDHVDDLVKKTKDQDDLWALKT